MASKSSTYTEGEKGAEIEEQLDQLEKLVDRLRVMYEQYFLGIQKQPPSHLHNEAERRVREITQLQIRNTGLRYRFATISQKFGSYNTYWKRVLRDIEAGRYVRDLSRIKRKAQQAGEDIPAEILAAMPKRMRDMIERDRKAAMARDPRRRGDVESPARVEDDDSGPAMISDAPFRIESGAMHLEESEFDLDALARDAASRLDGERGAGPALDTPSQIPRRRRSVDTMRRENEAARRRSDSGGKPRGDAKPNAAQALAAQVTAAARKTGSTPPPLGKRTATMPPLPSVPPGKRPPTNPPKPATTAPPPTAAPARPARRRVTLAPPPGMSDDDAKTIYKKFLKAREIVGENNDGMTYDRMLRTLRQQGTKIIDQYKAKGVEFGVVIKDNKVILKAKPK